MYRVFLALALTISTGSIGLAQESKRVPESQLEVTLSYAPVVKKTAPAVVNVYARRIVAQRARTSIFDDPFFSRFGNPRRREQNSLGSGVIVRSDGIIVTNNHVIASGDEFKVVLADRREFDAELLYQDEQVDLAILKIDSGTDELPFLEFEDSDSAEVGDLVLAIGNPFGVGQTVTGGLVSALARTKVGVSDFQFFIQTDAAINPGNSGGALVTMGGRLLGVNTAIFSRSGGSNGIGFAIPANMVKMVVESAISDGEVIRPWLGASGQTVTGDLAEALEIDKPKGVLINKVHPDGPADQAGIEIGDVILSIDGFEVNDLQSLRYRVATGRLGEKASIEFVRDGRTRKGKLPLERPPGSDDSEEIVLEGDTPFNGVTVVDMSPAFNEENGFDTMMRGVVVTDIDRRSRWGRMGFYKGDVILNVNGNEIESVRDLEDALSERSRRWDIRLLRGRNEVTLTWR